MALTLIRHTTPDVEKGICYGMTDLPLAASFDQEAAQVLAALPQHVSAVISSPLQRCRLLGARVAQHLGYELEVLDLWREMDFAAWEGTAWAAIPRDELDAWADAFMTYNGHGGESVAQLEARVRQALQTAPQNAVVITHHGVIKAAMAIHNLGAGWQAEIPFGGSVQLE